MALNTTDGMFHGLISLGYARNSRQAVGFFLFYFLIISIISVLVSLFSGLSVILGGPLGPSIPAGAGSFLNPVLILLLGIIVLFAKKGLTNPKMLLLLVLGVLFSIINFFLLIALFSFFPGPISIIFAIGVIFGLYPLGLVPLAYLTTLSPAGE